ncbi:MAG: BatD family protein [Gemmatimonadetes bacterium]|nr:BatD family protein [Gemmatimonadota bacterium]MDA1102285.1 BatD family protein [Gemmatimonadota bacterium]
MRHALRVLTTLILLAILPLGGVAQDTSARAYLTPGNAVGVGQQFVLNVEISGTQAMGREPRLPDMSFAQFLGNSTQSAVRTVNGRTAVTLTIQYRYQALVEGTFTIPSFEVVAGSATHDTAPLTLTVSTAPPATAGQASPGGIGPDDLFITAVARKATVREGEPVVVEYRIWTRVDVSNFGMTHVPEPAGFWVEDITPPGPPVVEQLERNGVQYASAVIRRVAMIPTGPGEKTLEPIGVEAQVRNRGGRDPFEDFFGRSSLFGTSSTPVTVLSNPLTVTVRPLPAGRPQPYSGVAGTLGITARLDRDSIEANDAVTLTLRVTGDGNIRAVPAPVLDLPPDFEAFPPEISESVSPTPSGLSGTKTFEYVLIPRAPGNREIPSVALGYFDVARNEYRRVETGSLPLTVTGTVVEGPASLARGGVSQLREDIRFIHLGALGLRPTGRPIFEGLTFWMFLLLPLAGLGGAVVLRRHWDLLEGDVAYARGRRASRVARKRLAEASRLMTGSDARPFYSEVARALRGLVADRLNLAEAGLQMTDVESALERARVEESVRADLQSCLEHCDRQRFAPPASDPEEKTRFLERAASLMTSLDRVMK